LAFTSAWRAYLLRMQDAEVDACPAIYTDYPGRVDEPCLIATTKYSFSYIYSLLFSLFWAFFSTVTLDDFILSVLIFFEMRISSLLPVAGTFALSVAQQTAYGQCTHLKALIGTS
jgi:hypothetical protein